MVAKGPSFPAAFGVASLPLQWSFALVATKNSCAKRGIAMNKASRKESGFMPAYAIEHKEAWPRVRGHGTRQRGMSCDDLLNAAPSRRLRHLGAGRHCAGGSGQRPEDAPGLHVPRI